MNDRDTGMNWLSKITPPGMSKIFSKRDTPDNLWIKCPKSGEMVFHKDLEAGLFVTPAGHHMRIGPAWRFQFTFDGEYTELDTPEVPRDPLKFKDDKPYTSRLTAARKKTGRDDAMAIAVGRIGGLESVVLVQNFAFMGGSLGMAAGESFIKAAEEAIARKAPLIVYTAAGGARMQEGTLSLMQMPRTTIAVEMLKDAGLPYIVVLTDPTTGGVTASYAMLGDVHIAEPGALIGFAGPRVIEQTIREKLPEGFQRAEYLLEKGMVDKVVHRRDIPGTLARMLRVMMKRPGTSMPASLTPPPADHVASDGGGH
ncbi:acetyl-coenzyme A carboxylase carboxyl transferase subunit beta [Maricaulis virginensis]|uniref:Acetyl-coenzyme A carboxylase carboxyl transferase subunit beta n=2 Tax=Maricaulis virginensis TaxID=144022 RepID=A0A9W6IPW7_9PROT|nr:acetyl-coenzyme A carboxylase carboxyl transferase subunit beta [Maricaulis virginensis]